MVEVIARRSIPVAFPRSKALEQFERYIVTSAVEQCFISSVMVILYHTI
jgi:hypothetical protein